MPPRLIAAHSSVARLRVPSDENDPFAGPRSRGSHGQASRRPHSDAKVAAVRRLIEQTTLTYGEIAARTGVGRASICRWTKDGQWQRPPFAPRATDTVPRARAGQRLKLRLLAERLRALAERHIRALEQAERLDTEQLLGALALVQAAKLEAIGRRGRRRIVSSESLISDETRTAVARKALAELRLADIAAAHLPKEALSLIVDARMPAEKSKALGPRGRRK